MEHAREEKTGRFYMDLTIIMNLLHEIAGACHAAADRVKELNESLLKIHDDLRRIAVLLAQEFKNGNKESA